MKIFSTFIAKHFPNLKNIDVSFYCEHDSWEDVVENLPLIQPASFQKVPSHIKGSLEFQGAFEPRNFFVNNNFFGFVVKHYPFLSLLKWV